jgi:uncharacterized membrane protein YgdD (TMEM256/DUF423 family)
MNAFRRLLVLFAGLLGAAGVAAAAAAAHMTSDPALATAAQFLMIGAVALAACAALGAAAGGQGWSFSDIGGGLIGLGTALFSGALAARVLWDVSIFPMAAPTGGMVLIVGWLALGLAAFQRGRSVTT